MNATDDRRTPVLRNGAETASSVRPGVGQGSDARRTTVMDFVWVTGRPRPRKWNGALRVALPRRG
mgnify:CR=1 FL=1